MQLDKETYTALRDDMRQELVRLHRTRAQPWETNAVLRRISRLDMAWARNQEWHDSSAGTLIEP
jgi:hypothetical protein